ncbi:hypothetical protein DPMN_158745 [Dreissena polymorpha]|uniref:Uncharacterized protein n=1 Tax=Dreissena polymorpha TaxID=45954 RepID=A0A9D4INH4_DREPO|nr:hypothetical protein DPMN_158745 [Dreissena polymorpha]
MIICWSGQDQQTGNFAKPAVQQAASAVQIWQQHQFPKEEEHVALCRICRGEALVLHLPVQALVPIKHTSFQSGPWIDLGTNWLLIGH